MAKVKWTIRMRFWRRVNNYTAMLAWKFANPGGSDWGRALRINHKHPLWRINEWVGELWINEFISKKTGHKLPPKEAVITKDNKED